MRDFSRAPVLGDAAYYSTLYVNPQSIGVLDNPRRNWLRPFALYSPLLTAGMSMWTVPGTSCRARLSPSWEMRGPILAAAANLCGHLGNLFLRHGNYTYGCSLPLPGARGGEQINGTGSGGCGHDTFTSSGQTRTCHHRQPGHRQATSRPSPHVSLRLPRRDVTSAPCLGHST